MFKKLLLIPACVACLLLISCSKETSIDSTVPAGGNGGNGGNNELLGNWQMLGVYVKGESIVEITGGGGPDAKTITHTEYYTKDNTGTFTFDPGTVTATNMSYTIDTSVVMDSYVDGIFIGSIDFPFTVTLPPTSSTSTYKLIGTDSIYFDKGLMSTGGGQTSTLPQGSKYTIKNDTLTMTTPFNFSSSQVVQGGATEKTTSYGKSVMTAKRL